MPESVRRRPAALLVVALSIMILSPRDASAAEVVDQQHAFDLTVGGFQVTPTQTLAQVVTTGIPGFLVAVGFRGGAAVGELRIEIQGVTSDGKPDNVALTSDGFPAATSPPLEPSGFRIFFFSNPLQMAAGDRFAIVLRVEAGSLGGAAQGVAAPPYPGGDGFAGDPSFQPVSWSLVSGTRPDLAFQTFVDPMAPPGERLKDMTFEDGSLVHPTSGADRRSGSPTLETAAPLKGMFSARTANRSGYLEARFDPTPDLYVSFYLRLDALPTERPRIFQIQNAGTTIANVQLRTGGQLRLRIGERATGPDSAPLQPGMLYRVGIHQTKGTGADAVAEAFLAEGDAPFGAPFARAMTGTWTTDADRLRFGATNSTKVKATFDDIRIDTGAMPPPS